MHLLPPAPTDDDLRALRTDAGRLARVADVVAARHGLPRGEVAPFANGSVPVVALGAAQVLKLYPPADTSHAEVERAALEAVAGRLPLATPEPVAAGTLDGWSYLVMTRLPGRPASEGREDGLPGTFPWRTIPRARQHALLERLGAAIRALHALPVADLSPVLRPDWAGFLAAQRAGCVAHHRARGADEAWLARLEPFLAGTPLAPARLALLHTEVMLDHVFVAEGPDGWALTGLLDLEPAVVGDPDYELAAVGVFVCRGDRALLGAFLDGYGVARADRPALARRVLAHALLHRYAHWPLYLRLLPAPAPGEDPSDLALRWFGPPA